MAETLNELKRELRRQKNFTKAKREINQVGIDRKAFKKAIKAEKRRRKFGSVTNVARRIKTGLAAGGKSFARVARSMEAKEKARLRAEADLRRRASRKVRTSRRRISRKQRFDRI